MILNSPGAKLADSNSGMGAEGMRDCSPSAPFRDVVERDRILAVAWVHDGVHLYVFLSTLRSAYNTVRHISSAASSPTEMVGLQ